MIEGVEGENESTITRQLSHSYSYFSDVIKGLGLKAVAAAQAPPRGDWPHERLHKAPNGLALKWASIPWQMVLANSHDFGTSTFEPSYL